MSGRTQLPVARRALSRALVDAHPEAFADPALGALYRNPWAHPPLPSGRSVLRWKLTRNDDRPRGYRARAVPMPDEPLALLEAHARAQSRVFFLGHASFLFETGGARIVVDPIFGRAGGLVPRVTKAATSPEAMGPVDLVLVTHGHHDHLDPSSLDALARLGGGRTVFVVPRGLARVLPPRCTRVVELGWWEHATMDGVVVTLVPAQHWHRRGLLDTNRALWGGFVVEGDHRLYHSGDTGYFGGFRAIGEAFGGVDAACLPLGAYAPTWFMATQHMDPDGSLAAFEDLRATHFVGMHWGTFDLSDEAIDGGPRYVESLRAAGRLPEGRVHVIPPGGLVALDGPRGHTSATVPVVHRVEPD